MAVVTLCAPLLRFLGNHADGDFYLQSITVDKERRGEGVGSALIDAIEGRARACGAIRLSLDVSAKNEGARRLYERRGLTVESTWPKLFFLPQIIVRMTKPLWAYEHFRKRTTWKTEIMYDMSVMTNTRFQAWCFGNGAQRIS